MKHEAVCFTMSVVDETESARACLQRVRSPYPASPVLLFVDTTDAALNERWSQVAKVIGSVRLVPVEPPLCGVKSGGRVLGSLFQPFLETDARWWVKIEPDTYVRRRFEHLPEDTCFFGTIQRGVPMPSLQGGCIGGVRAAVTNLLSSGVLESEELIDYAATWAKGNPTDETCGEGICFTMSVVDEFDFVAACRRHLRQWARRLARTSAEVSVSPRAC